MSHNFFGYCVKCKTKRLVRLERLMVVGEKGTLACVGECPECAAQVATLGRGILGDIDFDELGVNERKHRLPRQVVDVCGEIQRQVARYLARHSWELYGLHHKYFEQLVAEILASFRFKVELNVRLCGGAAGDEADVLAFRRVRGMGRPIGYVVECKRFKASRKVELWMATRLYGVKARHARDWGLDRALLVTTSAVTPQIRKEYGKAWDFEIRQHEQVVKWLQAYAEGSGKLYLPKQGLCIAGEELTVANLKMLERWHER